MELRFKEESDGVLAIRDAAQWAISEFNSPYEAPYIGYQSSMKIINSRTDRSYSMENMDTPLFMRIRSSADGEGNVGGGNYCKIWPGIKLMGALAEKPFLRMTYYCNPTKEDRNIEFDVDKNLFKGLPPEERVINP